MKRTLPAVPRLRIVAAIAVPFAAAVLVAWRDMQPTAASLLTTSPVLLGDIENTVMASGTLEASQMVSVGAQVSGQIKSLKVSLGDWVSAGALVAEIDSITQEN